MTEQQMAANKQRFMELCNEHIHRDGLDKVLAYLEKSDFYIAPSSSRFHLNEDGGLCLHSINVFEAACKIYNEMVKPAIMDGTSPFTEEVSMESIAIATLFHDLCKIKLYHKADRWKKDENNRWVTYPGYEVKDDFPLGYMRLKPEEMLAIRWHMGMFDMGESGSSLRRSFYAATEKSVLVSIVHSADFLVSNLWEKTTTY